MLLREVRCCFFQERVLHLELADTAFQVPDSLAGGHIGRQRRPGKFSTVRLSPEPECGIVNLEFARHLGNRPRRRGVDHFLDGLLLELRSVMLRFPRHLIPFLSGENPIGSPVRKIWGTSEAAAALETAVPITMKGQGPAWFLEGLAAHMTAHPDAL